MLKTAGGKVAARLGDGPYDMVLVRLDAIADLSRLADARRRITPNGMIWAVWPKGRKEFREDDIRRFGPQAGLVDVKVMSFSDELSGLKLVIPVAQRNLMQPEAAKSRRAVEPSGAVKPSGAAKR